MQQTLLNIEESYELNEKSLKTTISKLQNVDYNVTILLNFIVAAVYF